MSEVFEDMDMSPLVKAPYSVLTSALQLGIFSKSSHISYSQNQIRILMRHQLDNCFSLLTKIVAQKRELSLQSVFMKNGEYFSINSAQLRKNLYRSFLKTISIDPTLKILINQQGRLSIKMHTFLTDQVEYRHTKQTGRIEKLIEKTYIQLSQNFNPIFHKLKQLIEPVFQKNIYNNQDQLQRLDIIKNSCRFLYVQPSFIKRNGARGKQKHRNLPVDFMDEQQFQLTDFFDMKVQSDKMKQSSEKLKLFTQLWEISENLHKVQDTSLYNTFSLVKIKTIYKSNVKLPESRVYRGVQNQQIFSKIHIQDINNVDWIRFYEGGFGSLYKANINFFYVSQNSKDSKKFTHEKPIQRPMVMKVDKSSMKYSRIQVEKLILKCLKGKRSRYLPQFYESSQSIPKYGNYLLSDFYQQKSLQIWNKIFGQYESIFTKILIIMHICHGLQFIHENGIIHRDLKTSNMLVDSKIGIKIIDFGQSYHPSIQTYLKSKGRDCRPGFTLPNSAPQIFCADQSLMKKASFDIFSLGLIIYQILFGKTFFTGMSDALLKNIYMKQARNIDKKRQDDEVRWKSVIKQKIYLSAQMLSYYGPAELLTPLLNVIQRCLDPKTQNRPHLDWIIIIIKQTSRQFLDFYSL